MKRILTLSLFTLLLSSSVIAQKNGGNCIHKDLVREFVNIADSISRFMDKSKATVGDAGWDAFIKAAENSEGEKAFDHLGKLSVSVKTTLDELVNQLGEQMQKLNRAIRTDDKMTDADVKEIINREINCYLSDKEENNLPKLIQATGKLAPPEIGTGTGDDPCEDAFGNCLATASAVHSSGLNSCLTLAVGSGGIFGPLGGLFTGLLCLGNIENAYNNAKIRCFKNLMSCLKNN